MHQELQIMFIIIIISGFGTVFMVLRLSRTPG